MPRSEHLDWIFDAGAYYDSGRNTALVAGAGVLWRSSERLRLGAALVYFDSESRELNPVPAFGFWITFWLDPN